MATITKVPRNMKLYAAALLAAALVITLLAVTFANGPVWAQNTGTTDDYTNLSTYPDPQPCGPGAGTAFMKEPHKIPTGHYALFDAYWRTIKEGASVGGMDVPGVGVLHTNLCPPLVSTTKTDGGFGGVTVTTTRSARNGGMDVEEAIMHVLDTHKADVVATNAEVTDGGGQLSLEEYTKVKEFVSAGDEVWWLRLDDPDTVDDPNTPEKENDETSELGIGFSTLLLDKNDWYREDEDGNVLKPMRYRFVAERHPADPTDVPHFFAYKAPEANGAPAELVWDSARAGEGVMELDTGEYKELQWVFTKPGTYILSVQLLGNVRKENPHPQDHADYDPSWKPISGNETETSEVYRYTIQVSDPLDETEPPIFGANLSVDENTPAGVKVGDPIPVYNADAEVLYYDLTGPGHGNFKPVVASTDPHAVQIVVKEGASLDYDTTPPTESYELNLTVTDRLDHEGNFNPYPDDVLIVRIDLNPQDPGVVLEVDNISPAVGETVNFIARYEPTPQQRGQTFSYQWAERIQTKEDGIKWHVLSSGPSPTWSVSQTSMVSKVYQASVVVGTNTPPTLVHSEDIRVTWGGP